MSTTKLYPPYIEGKLPAVYSPTGFTIPFQLNRVTSRDDFNKMRVIIKTVQTNTVKAELEVDDTYIYYDSAKKSYYVTFNATSAQLVQGQYYKVQLACVKDNNVGYYSSVATIKYTHKPTAIIEGLSTTGYNPNQLEYVGVYNCEDSSEKVYSYCFTLKDEQNSIVATSGELIHNSSTDNSTKSSFDKWILEKSLQQNRYYSLTYSVKTMNGIEVSSMAYSIQDVETIDLDINTFLVAEVNNEDGCVNLGLAERPGVEPTPISGSFVVTRYSDEDDSWHEVFRFHMVQQYPDAFKRLWTDFTIQHGVHYTYALQGYNVNGLYSNRLYHVVKNPDIYSSQPYLGDSKTPYPVYADFEDSFLFDGERQLKIRFNPKVSSFKSTVLESKTDTLGGQYPFVFRNGKVEYKEFPISGLLSYLSDPNELFMNGVFPAEYTTKRSHTRGNGAIKDAGTHITSDSFYRERKFKMEALKWLTDGKTKLFRSPGEGNYIVRVMNVSLSPNDTVGRMLHTFSGTAYEIAEYNYTNLNYYGFINVPNNENRTLKFRQLKLSETNKLRSAVYNINNAYLANITEATPGTVFNLYFADMEGATEIVIGATRSYYIPITDRPLVAIELAEGYIDDAILTYGFYDTDVPDNFSYVTKVTTHDEIAQFIGTGLENNIMETLNDIRRQVGRIYYLKLSLRSIIPIYYIRGAYYRDEFGTELMGDGDWSDSLFYYEVYSEKYYNGIPSNNTLMSAPPTYWFKLNDELMLNVLTGNRYTDSVIMDAVLHDLTTVSPDMFDMITNARYEVLTDLDDTHYLCADVGVMVDIVYQIKELEYSLESYNDDVKAAKDAWLTAKNAYENAVSNGEASREQKAIMDQKYAIYIELLEEALEAEKEETRNALR